MNAIKTGALFAFSLFIWTLLEYAFGLHTTLIEYHPIVTNLFLIPAILILARGIRIRKRELEGSMSFKEGFSTGVATALVVGMLSPVMVWIYTALINPSFFSTFIEYAVTHGKATREQAEEYFNLRSYCLQSSIGMFVFGTIVAAIASFRLRTKSAE